MEPQNETNDGDRGGGRGGDGGRGRARIHPRAGHARRHAAAAEVPHHAWRSAGADERRGQPARSRGQAGRCRAACAPWIFDRRLRRWHGLSDAAESDRGAERRSVRGRLQCQHDHTPARHEQRRQGGRTQGRGVGVEWAVRHGDQQRILLRRQHRQRRAMEVRAWRHDASRHTGEDRDATERRRSRDPFTRLQRGWEQAVRHHRISVERGRRTGTCPDPRDEPRWHRRPRIRVGTPQSRRSRDSPWHR